MKKATRVLVMSMATVCTVSGCGSKTDDSKAAEQILKIEIESELSTADVSLAMDNTACSVMSQIGEGLFSFDTTGEAKPALATEKVEPTNDGLTYTFTIRDGATWSNGEPITAQDFEYSWKRTVTPETASPQAYYFEGLANYSEIAKGEADASTLGVKALDDQTLEVELAYPMSYFQQLLAVPAFYPLNQAFVEEAGAEYGTSAEKTLCNGPFILENWSGNDINWNYRKNEAYWDQEHVTLDQIDVQVVKEVNTAKNLFEDGQLDIVKISGEIVQQEQANPALQIRELPGTYYIQMNTEKELFANKKIRQAVALALDSETLATKILNDGSKKSDGFVPTGFINQVTGKDFTDGLGDLNPYDEAKAQQLWKEGLEEVGESEIKVSILCSDSESAKKISEYMQGALNDAFDGLKVNVTPVPFQTRLEKSRSGDFDIVLGGWTPVYADPVDFLNLLQSENSNNFGRWHNAEFDALIEQANETYANDYEKRFEALQEADRLVSEEAPLVPLFQMTEARLVNERVENLEMGPLGSVYYKEVKIKE